MWHDANPLTQNTTLQTRRVIHRKSDIRARLTLENQGVHPLLASLYAGRGVTDKSELDTDLKNLLPFHTMQHVVEAAAWIDEQIEQNKRFLIVSDYDCDGATACAVGIRAMRLMGAQVDYIVPDRMALGYGLSCAIVDLAAELKPDVLITVDNGIASIEGVARAQELGIEVVITDHHLPADQLPKARYIINPNQTTCPFQSKHIAGVGVMFYLMMALRACQRERGKYTLQNQPRLDALLDLVALGTVADLVQLDANNRRLVAQGLKRIRAKRCQAGILALLSIAQRDYASLKSEDLGFVIGPRLNAAGRLQSMNLGIDCLITDHFEQALQYAEQLEELNRKRRNVEDEVREQALELVELDSFANNQQMGVTLYQPTWHEGVIGIVASRIKEKLHRPVFIFTRAQDGSLKGSGRSIQGFHLRDALDWMSKQDKKLFMKFGGHAMAAGCSIDSEGYERFSQLFDSIAKQLLQPQQLNQSIEVDGSLAAPSMMSLRTAKLLAQEVWGQGFSAPIFYDSYKLLSQKIFADKHLKARVQIATHNVELIAWNLTQSLPEQGHIAYRLAEDNWEGIPRLRLILEAVDTEQAP